MSSRLPALTSKKVIRTLKRAGFFIHHTTGSHVTLKHPDHPTRRITVPQHSGDLKTGTLHAIIKQAELTVEEFKELL